MRYSLFISTLFSLFYATVGSAQSVDFPTEQLQQSERRQSIIESQFNPKADQPGIGNLGSAELPVANTTQVCFEVAQLLITGLSQQLQHKASFITDAIEDEGYRVTATTASSFRLLGADNTAPCLNVTNIQRIATRAQNMLVDQGYITSRVLIPNQDLRSGELRLRLVMGSVDKIVVDERDNESSFANRATTFNAFPTDKGRVLNLRDLEQGLENLRRVPSVTATMDIKPSERVNESDILVSWQQQPLPFRLNFSTDNSGSESTGEYLGTVSFSWDNPLQINDIFYASYTRNLSHGKKQRSVTGEIDKGSTHNYAINYSFPLGYWSVDIGMSDYHYDQVVAGINRNYHYTGDSTQGSVNVSKVLYRDDQHKFSARAGLWRKSTKSYIDDSEISNQRRRTGGWQASLSQRSYFSKGTLSSTVGYKRGTRAFGGMAAPEELFDEGTAKMKIWTADIRWQMPFHIGQESFNFDSSFHGQWNKSLLTSQDRMAIGGRYSVRGFNGSKTLSGERGWYLRNNISWNYRDHHQFYIGVDVGHVSGISTENLPGQSLSGAVIGFKGQFKKAGTWHYDIFAGTPIHEPTGFNADSTVVGFNFSYSL